MPSPQRAAASGDGGGGEKTASCCSFGGATASTDSFGDATASTDSVRLAGNRASFGMRSHRAAAATSSTLPAHLQLQSLLSPARRELCSSLGCMSWKERTASTEGKDYMSSKPLAGCFALHLW